MRRRHVIGALAAACVTRLRAGEAPAGFGIDYVLASALYGDMGLEVILPEIARAGVVGLDIWPRPHGTQREEVAAMGVDAFASVLEKHGAKLTVSSSYKLGWDGLQPEMAFMKKLGGKIIVCGATGPKDPSGEAARDAVKGFLEKMEPHADAAGEHGLVIAVENHAGQLLSHPDSIRYFAEFNRHPSLGVAFAPHHLQGSIGEIPDLIRSLGKGNLPFIYFQEHGIGSQKKVEKSVELEQLPGRGKLDYVPIIQALRDVEFGGVAEIFMHPTPRGVPVLDTAAAITDAINESRKYINGCIAKTK